MIQDSKSLFIVFMKKCIDLQNERMLWSRPLIVPQILISVFITSTSETLSILEARIYFVIIIFNK